MRMLVLVCCLAGGCAPTSDKAHAGPAFEVEREYASGAVKFWERLSRKQIQASQSIRLELEVHAPEDYEVVFPEFGAKLGEFDIVDDETPASRLGKDGRLVHQRSYVLEPFLAGTYRIPRMIITFGRRGEETRHELASDDLSVEVASLMDEAGEELKIRELEGPLGLPFSLAWWWLAIPLAVLAGIVVAAWFSQRRRRVVEKSEVLPPHVAARHALSALLERGLVKQGMVKEFYQELSDILRRYIEERFGLRAPERTTEEFMTDLAATDLLGLEHKKLLRDFLHHCDLVKFAKYAPVQEEIERATCACQAFIDETEPAQQELP